MTSDSEKVIDGIINGFLKNKNNESNEKIQHIIVTAGENYTDIDALACAIALNELLNEFSERYVKSKSLSEVVLPGQLNITIPPTIRSWNLYFSNIPVKHSFGQGYIIVDISEPSHIAKFVEHSKIISLIDHRSGFEEYWHEQLGSKAKIEQVGACATQIFEEIENAQYGTLDTISMLSDTARNLLYTAIFSNTLNLTANVTTDRDRRAFAKLKEYISLPENWIEEYYNECEVELFRNPIAAIKSDTKTFEINSYTFTIAQLELWNAKKFLDEYSEIVYDAIDTSGTWLLTIPNISEGFNYFITNNDIVKQILQEKLEVTFNYDIGKSKSIWMRKEVIKEIRKYFEQN